MDYKAWIRVLPCCVCGYPGTTHDDGGRYNDPAHVTSRGAGGVDQENLVPLCRSHHVIQHAKGMARFQAKYQVDLFAIAKKLWEEYSRMNQQESV